MQSDPFIKSAVIEEHSNVLTSTGESKGSMKIKKISYFLFSKMIINSKKRKCGCVKSMLFSMAFVAKVNFLQIGIEFGLTLAP